VALSNGINLTVSLFHHDDYPQPSVIAHYEKLNAPANQSFAITGCHFDTSAIKAKLTQELVTLINGTRITRQVAVNVKNPTTESELVGPNPGADDAASGASVVYETLRVLATSGFVPQSTALEFHWYAAEEPAVIGVSFGSADIAATYRLQSKPVIAYLNLDQSGFVEAGTVPAMGLVMTDTTTRPTELLRNVITNYTTIGYVEDADGGSDHAAWWSLGFETAMAFESSHNVSSPYHDLVLEDGSALDTMERVNTTHVIEFTKSTLGFLVELTLSTR
jgi:hypothetical protein